VGIRVPMEHYKSPCVTFVIWVIEVNAHTHVRARAHTHTDRQTAFGYILQAQPPDELETVHSMAFA